MDYLKINKLRKFIEEIAPYYAIELHDGDETLILEKKEPKDEKDDEARIGF